VVFSEPEQILSCLETIAADREVEVVRVNNKLAHAYDSCLTAGYRCVARTAVPSRGLVTADDAQGTFRSVAVRMRTLPLAV
jgi:hypothetical protein